MQDTTKVPAKLAASQIESLMNELDSAWSVSDDKKELIKCFEFKGFYKTMGFVNAVAFIAQKTLHHPDMQVSFNKCVIHYTTHDAGGITQNDFDCAKAIDQLMA